MRSILICNNYIKFNVMEDNNFRLSSQCNLCESLGLLYSSIALFLIVYTFIYNRIRHL
jgi:hypothetical protein